MGRTGWKCLRLEAARPAPPASPALPALCIAAVSVFLSSIAMVSGPTPPGTGVSAPATSSTSGWTSPRTSEPRRSNAARRFEPAANSRSIVARSSTRVVPTSTTVAPGLTNCRGDERRPPQRRHENVGLAGHLRQVHRARMADRHGGVPVQQQQGHRLADDVAPPDDDRPRARDRDLRSLQQLDDSRRRAGDQRRPILDQTSNVDRVKAVHVLVRARAHRRRGVPRRVPWPRAAATAPGCRRGHRSDSDDRRRRRSSSIDAVAGNRSRSARSPVSAADFSLLRDVERGCGIVADEHEAESGRPPGARRERLHARADLGANGIGDGDTIQQPGGHYEAASPSSCFSESGRPRTTSWSPGRMGVAGSGLNSIRWSPRWMATTMTPNRCRRLASRID